MQLVRIWALACLLFVIPEAASAKADGSWVAAWVSAQQVPEERNALPEDDLRNATLRQTVRLSHGGERFRLRLSNLYGTQPLKISETRVARSSDPRTPRVDPLSVRSVTFNGRNTITIPAGAEYVSDPFALSAPAMSHLSVSIYLPSPPSQQTSHPGSRATSYIVSGNQTGATDLPGAKTVAHWYQISALETLSTPRSAALVTFGDSITDGFGVQPDTDQRWPDFLARRLSAEPRTRHVSVINQGIGGNRLLLDGLGPNGLARFDRDVLAPAGVRYVLVLEGVNDLGNLTREGPVGKDAHAALVEEMIGALSQMVERARSRGIKIIGATILPFGASGYYKFDPLTEADRQAVNAWIRAPGNFDAVVDFDAVMRDPADPTKLASHLDSGDGLHPSIEGYRVMAEAVPEGLFLDAVVARNSSE